MFLDVELDCGIIAREEEALGARDVATHEDRVVVPRNESHSSAGAPTLSAAVGLEAAAVAQGTQPWVYSAARRYDVYSPSLPERRRISNVGRAP